MVLIKKNKLKGVIHTDDMLVQDVPDTLSTCLEKIPSIPENKKVQEIKQAIDSGTYFLDDEKIDGVIDAMMTESPLGLSVFN